MKKHIYKVFYVITLLVFLAGLFQIVCDFYLYDSSYNSAPFYLTLLLRVIEFIIPSGIVFLIGKVIKKKFSE